jgi:tetracycline repressor-like protein
LPTVTRQYRLGARQASVERTSQAILAAARRLVAQAPATAVSVGAIARAAGVSRLTIYQRFGSRSGLLAALAPSPPTVADGPTEPREALRRHLLLKCEAWAADAAVHRHLPAHAGDGQAERRLAEQLLAADALRPGCSIREAEDVIGALGSFGVFDRLHHDGRRPPAAVAEILMRMGAAILG